MYTRVERRSDRRYTLKNAGVSLSETRPCILIDISESGFAFCYRKDGGLVDDPAYLARRLFGENEMCLDMISFSTVCDGPLQEEAGDGPHAVRRRGVRFIHLTHAQKTMLRYFIWLRARQHGPGR